MQSFRREEKGTRESISENLSFHGILWTAELRAENWIAFSPYCVESYPAFVLWTHFTAALLSSGKMDLFVFSAGRSAAVCSSRRVTAAWGDGQTLPAVYSKVIMHNLATVCPGDPVPKIYKFGKLHLDWFETGQLPIGKSLNECCHLLKSFLDTLYSYRRIQYGMLGRCYNGTV